MKTPFKCKLKVVTFNEDDQIISVKYCDGIIDFDRIETVYEYNEEIYAIMQSGVEYIIIEDFDKLSLFIEGMSKIKQQ